MNRDWGSSLPGVTSLAEPTTCECPPLPITGQPVADHLIARIYGPTEIGECQRCHRLVVTPELLALHGYST